MNKFDLRKYLTENKLTEQSKKINEGLSLSESDEIAKIMRDVVGIARVAGPGASEQLNRATKGVNDAVKDLIKSAAYDGSLRRSKIEDTFEESGLQYREFLSQLKKAVKKI